MIANTLLSIKAMVQTDLLYKKVSDLTAGIKQEFRAKGIVLPTRNSRGIRLDNYTVIKNINDDYSILNSADVVVYDKINLSYTAIVIANSLALGQIADPIIIENDRQYGYQTFEEDNYRRMVAVHNKKKDWDRAETALLKQKIAHEKAKIAKKYVVASFEKLRRLR